MSGKDNADLTLSFLVAVAPLYASTTRCASSAVTCSTASFQASSRACGLLRRGASSRAIRKMAAMHEQYLPAAQLAGLFCCAWYPRMVSRLSIHS